MCYDPKTSGAKNFSPFAKMVKTLNTSSDSTRKTELAKIMNIDNIVRNLVAEMAHGNTDGILNGKNYYIYLPKNGLFEIIPHDYDFALGFKSFNLTSTKNIWQYDIKSRPLYTNVVPVVWKSTANTLFWDLLDQFAWSSSKTIWRSRIEEYRRIISPGVAMDKWHQVDLGWNNKEFLDSSLKGGILRVGTTGSCGSRDCLWVTSVGVHIDYQNGQIQKYLSPRVVIGKKE